MFSSIVLFAFGIIVSVNAFYSPSDDVIQLDPSNFDHLVVQSSDVWIVEFYAPWCGHCKRLEPKFEKAATLLKKDTNIRLAKVDGTAETQLAVIHNITGYETKKKNEFFFFRKFNFYI